MNQDIKNLLESSNSTYQKNRKILEIIFKYLSTKTVIHNTRLVECFYDNNFTEECLLDLNHPIYEKIDIYKNNLHIYLKKIPLLYDIRFEVSYCPVKLSLDDIDLENKLCQILYIEDGQIQNLQS